MENTERISEEVTEEVTEKTTEEVTEETTEETAEEVTEETTEEISEEISEESSEPSTLVPEDNSVDTQILAELNQINFMLTAVIFVLLFNTLRGMVTKAYRDIKGGK